MAGEVEVPDDSDGRGQGCLLEHLDERSVVVQIVVGSALAEIAYPLERVILGKEAVRPPLEGHWMEVM